VEDFCFLIQVLNFSFTHFHSNYALFKIIEMEKLLDWTKVNNSTKYNKICKTCNTIICKYIYIYKHKRVITMIYYKYISTIVDTVKYVR